MSVHEDSWGFDPGYARRAAPLLGVLYDHYWRVTASGAADVPATGPVMLVANHAGPLPWDAVLVAAALQRAGQPRRPRLLVPDSAFERPWLSIAARRLGGVPDTPENAERLLAEGHLVCVFPEGARGARKPYDRRYRLESFGPGEFAEIALRTAATIVPTAVVGSEESYPRLGSVPGLGRALGAISLPRRVPNPLAAVPLPARWRIDFGAPLIASGHDPHRAADRTTVLELSDMVRDRLQQAVYDTLVKRERAF
ncbi:MAG: lysophospholipid acyltransferase family protein [Solirubrobacteraceae bacterium]